MRNNFHFFTTFVIHFILFQSPINQFAFGQGSQVKFLPGFEGPLPFYLETGYIGVDDKENVQLFYYFVKSKSNPKTDPVLLWLVGGPGCTSLSSLFFETGPLLIDQEDYESLPTLSMHPYSFAEAANILFLELPVGTGYSYARTHEALQSTGQQSCSHAHQFVRKWMANHPEFASNPFYVGGNSYVGITVPVIAHMISDGNEAGINPQVNLTGYVLGNPGAFPDERNYRISFAHGMGLIPNDLFESLKQNCKENYIDVDSNNLPCLKDVQTFHQLVDILSVGQVLETKCDSPDHGNGQHHARKTCNDHHLLKPICKVEENSRNSPYCPKNTGVLRQMVDDFLRQILDTVCDPSLLGQSSSNRHHQGAPMKSCFNYRLKFIDPWARDLHVQEALHVHKGTTEEFILCNKTLPHTDFLWDTVPYHVNLSARGYRSLIYSGDHDLVVPIESTQKWIASLNYSTVDEWRPWYVEAFVAGYTRSYANNMTFASIKGGSHTPSASHPKECAAMFKRWISYQSL